MYATLVGKEIFRDKRLHPAENGNGTARGDRGGVD
jgi:hypothetical protein